MADFDIIEDVSKNIPKGKDFKKMIPFIVIGGGLGVVALFMKRNSTTTSNQSTPSNDEIGSGSDIDGVLTDYANQVNESIKASNSQITDYYDDQFTDLAGGLYDIVQSQNTLINQLRSDFNAKIEEVQSDQTVPVYNQATTIQQWTGSAPSETSGSSIYFDSVDDDVQFNNLIKNVSSAITTGKISNDQAQQIKLEVAGLGNNGVGWTKENFADNKQRLENDPSYVQSEIERTKLVIQNRTGMSTTAQENYLKSLEQYK